MKVLIATAALMVLAACGTKPQDKGGVTAEESQKLNEAEEMLDASPDSLVAADGSHLGNGESAANASAETAGVANQN